MDVGGTRSRLPQREDADFQEAVNGLVERKTPLIWSAGTAKRVLDTKLSAADQTMLLLHQALGWVPEADLIASIEYSNPSVYRAKILRVLHKDRKIEYDEAGQRAANIFTQRQRVRRSQYHRAANGLEEIDLVFPP